MILTKENVVNLCGAHPFLLMTLLTVTIFLLGRYFFRGQLGKIFRFAFFLPIAVPCFIFVLLPAEMKTKKEASSADSAFQSEISGTLYPVREPYAQKNPNDLSLTLTDSKKSEADFSSVSISSSNRQMLFQTAGYQDKNFARNTAASQTDSASSGSSSAPTSSASGTSPEFTQAPVPLAEENHLQGYAGSQRSIVDSQRAEMIPGNIKTAEFTDSSKNPEIKPSGFQTNIPTPSLQIPTGQLRLTENQSAEILNSVTQSIYVGIEAAKKSAVHIEAKVQNEGKAGPRESEETGSGIIIKTKKGDFYVVTNFHVAGKAVSTDQVRIVLTDKRVLHPEKILTCQDFDLALLKLREKNLPAATLGNSDDVKIIDPVLAIGSPFGLEWSVTQGIVSGRERREIPLGNKNQIQDFIQTDAAVNPGNSGGPLLNARGEVIGIVTAIASRHNESSGVAFAIPMNNVLHVVSQLIRNGVYKRPFIGIQLDNKFERLLTSESGNNAELMNQYVIGTRVKSVVKGSPAALVGLQQGDIILSYNNTPVENDKHFESLVSLSNINDQPTLLVLRNGSRYSFSPQLTEKGGNTEDSSAPSSQVGNASHQKPQP